MEDYLKLQQNANAVGKLYLAPAAKNNGSTKEVAQFLAFSLYLSEVGVELMDEAGVHDEAARRRDPDFAAMLASPTRATKLGIANDGSALQTVDAVSGALMLLPRTLFDRLAGFDEGYRLHAEDLDLCRRARVAGATVAIANDIRVLHVRGVSSRARPLFVEWHKHRGLWRYFRKFEATRRSVFTSVAVLAIIWLRFFMVFVRKSTTTGQGKS